MPETKSPPSNSPPTGFFHASLRLQEAHPAPYRYERKFVADNTPTYRIEPFIRTHPSFFREIYPPRRVNNLYFDTAGFRFYTDSTNGTSERIKVRIRWYGDPEPGDTGARLELKTKAGHVSAKHVFELEGFEMRQGKTAADFRQMIRTSGLPEDIRHAVTQLQPVLLNRYRRRYWLCHDGRYRLTLDSAMEFHAVHRLGIHRLQPRHDDDTVVLELKYKPCDDNGLDTITAHLPLRLSRSSKYVKGMDLVYNGVFTIANT